MMNPGDTIVVHMFDARLRGGGHALEGQRVRRLTTDQSGFMIASAANGFMNDEPGRLLGHGLTTSSPSTRARRRNNLIPWGAGPYMLDNRVRDSATSSRAPRSPGRGPLHVRRLSRTRIWTNCQGRVRHGEAEDPSLEPDDSPLLPVRGHPRRDGCAPNLVTGCRRVLQRRDRGPRLRRDVVLRRLADVDRAGACSRARPLRPSRPATDSTYPQIQFETDLAATEFSERAT